IVRTAAGENQKMRILAGTDSTYTIEWGPLESAGEPTVVHLTKDDDFNYIYFSFADGTVNPEPPKTTWDVVFTRYRPMVYHNDFQTYVPYPASGVLLNPYKTHGAADSTTPF